MDVVTAGFQAKRNPAQLFKVYKVNKKLSDYQISSTIIARRLDPLKSVFCIVNHHGWLNRGSRSRNAAIFKMNILSFRSIIRTFLICQKYSS